MACFLGEIHYLDCPMNIIIHVQLKYSGADLTVLTILTLNLQYFGVKWPISTALRQ